MKKFGTVDAKRLGWEVCVTCLLGILLPVSFAGLPRHEDPTETALKWTATVYRGQNQSSAITRSPNTLFTCMHGLTQGGPIRVVYRGQSYNARVVAKDHANDVAILEIDQDVFTPADFATQDSVSVGSFAMAVGTPHGFTDSVSIGSISAKNRTLPSLPGRVFIQTDTAINPGNSGGALVCIVNGRPKVVGMNARIYSKVRESNGLGFAIPTDVLQAVQ